MISFTGQENLKTFFAKIISEDRIPHAMLICGPEGSGKMALTLWFVKFLFCQQKQEDNFCDNCPSCKKVDELVHPDLHFAFPVVKHEKFKREDTISTHFINEWRSFLTENLFGNLNSWLNYISATDKSSNINVAECLNIIKTLGLKSYTDNPKVQIIWNAESLGKDGNRLLKLIEEPSDDTIIILIAEDRNKLLNTILSRCQIIAVPPFSDDAIFKHLEDNFELESQELDQISYMSNGNILEAIKLASHAKGDFSNDMLEWLRRSYKADPDDLIEMVNELQTWGRQGLKNFFKYILHFLREYLAAYNLQNTDHLRLNPDEKNALLKMQRIINRSKTAELEKIFSENITLIDRNLSLKIMLMSMSLEINEILRAEVNKFVPRSN